MPKRSSSIQEPVIIAARLTMVGARAGFIGLTAILVAVLLINAEPDPSTGTTGVIETGVAWVAVALLGGIALIDIVRFLTGQPRITIDGESIALQDVIRGWHLPLADITGLSPYAWGKRRIMGAAHYVAIAGRDGQGHARTVRLRGSLFGYTGKDGADRLVNALRTELETRSGRPIPECEDADLKRITNQDMKTLALLIGFGFVVGIVLSVVAG